MRGVVRVPSRCARDALRRLAFVFAFCAISFAPAGSATSADGNTNMAETTVRHAPAPSLRQMLDTGTDTHVADDASRSNLRRLLDSATRAGAPQSAATVRLTASASSGDEVFGDGFDRPCRALGASCGSGGDCCSMTCGGNTCINASGTFGCHADSDICSAASDCCSGQCNLTGASGGICEPLSDFVVTSCAVDGEPCSASSACCSQLCASVPGGGMACQSPSGCNVTHDLCTTDTACCGSFGSYGASSSPVTCVVTPGMSAGLCKTPSGCKPNGSLCGGTSGTDCCSGNAQNVDTCGPDLVGVNRCHSLTCGASGQACASSADCCTNAPCVPSASGTPPLVCAATACEPSTAACTTDADCCSGLRCAIAPGAFGGTCTL